MYKQIDLMIIQYIIYIGAVYAPKNNIYRGFAKLLTLLFYFFQIFFVFIERIIFYSYYFVNNFVINVVIYICISRYINIYRA